jgi:hypothetical protein
MLSGFEEQGEQDIGFGLVAFWEYLQKADMVADTVFSDADFEGEMCVVSAWPGRRRV